MKYIYCVLFILTNCMYNTNITNAQTIKNLQKDVNPRQIVQEFLRDSTTRFRNHPLWQSEYLDTNNLDIDFVVRPRLKKEARDYKGTKSIYSLLDSTYDEARIYVRNKFDSTIFIFEENLNKYLLKESVFDDDCVMIQELNCKERISAYKSERRYMAHLKANMWYKNLLLFDIPQVANGFYYMDSLYVITSEIPPYGNIVKNLDLYYSSSNNNQLLNAGINWIGYKEYCYNALIDTSNIIPTTIDYSTSINSMKHFADSIKNKYLYPQKDTIRNYFYTQLKDNSEFNKRLDQLMLHYNISKEELFTDTIGTELFLGPMLFNAYDIGDNADSSNILEYKNISFDRDNYQIIIFKNGIPIAAMDSDQSLSVLWYFDTTRLTLLSLCNKVDWIFWAFDCLIFEDNNQVFVHPNLDEFYYHRSTSKNMKNIIPYQRFIEEILTPEIVK